MRGYIPIEVDALSHASHEDVINTPARIDGTSPVSRDDPVALTGHLDFFVGTSFVSFAPEDVSTVGDIIDAVNTAAGIAAMTIADDGIVSLAQANDVESDILGVVGGIAEADNSDYAVIGWPTDQSQRLDIGELVPERVYDTTDANLKVTLVDPAKPLSEILSPGLNEKANSNSANGTAVQRSTIPGVFGPSADGVIATADSTPVVGKFTAGVRAFTVGWYDYVDHSTDSFDYVPGANDTLQSMSLAILTALPDLQMIGGFGSDLGSSMWWFVITTGTDAAAKYIITIADGDENKLREVLNIQAAFPGDSSQVPYIDTSSVQFVPPAGSAVSLTAYLQTMHGVVMMLANRISALENA